MTTVAKLDKQMRANPKGVRFELAAEWDEQESEQEKE
jgi:hypothetical protein